ncbi:HK97 family phage major capsid protein [Kribbella sp. VKM Ac-2527]|uniref:HK97 family phage major capsid protein n=1 Tax=Kribbella caucasensis TaxID=2512215 RepID=A0A4V3CAZ0_9ACTN|nr:phage major capsid protein [Kribbella sp. VKM Ac-2527]TDO52622.1 HK97 family phage major capsid protein [Kribbella sp. VKM Ac-2527]
MGESMIITKLRERRAELIKNAETVSATADAYNRNLSSGEQRVFDEAMGEIDQIDQRMTSLAEGEQRVKDIESSFAGIAGRPAERGAPGPQDAELDKAFRSALLAKNPAPIDIAPTRRGYSWPGIERRDLLKTTATQALPTSVYDRIFTHMVEHSAVLRAGATVVNTDTGETLAVPKSTAFSTAALTAEAGSITESDPTLAVVNLGAYKYAAFFQVSSELATDGHADLLGFLSRQAGEALALAYGAHLMTGTGSGQPTGAVTTATAGITGPTGTASSFGTQATAGQGTDLLNSLYGSVAEPYTLSPATAFLLRNATKTAIANLKTSAGEIVGTQYLAQSPAPFLVDPNVAAMGASAESVVFGDWSRYVVRIAGGLRFERSDDFAFQNDLVSFRAIIRLDGALVDANALKTFTHSAS